MTDDELFDALDGLHAYDMGAVDSGIHDEALRARVIEELDRDRKPYQLFSDRLARIVRDRMLSEENLAEGYGLEDVQEFLEWWAGER